MRYPLTLIPAWCGMPAARHDDGLGGCWAILYGDVAKYGESWCVECPEYRKGEGATCSQPCSQA